MVLISDENQFQDSAAVEQDFIELRDEALAKLDQSEQDLEAALDIRNRSLTLQQLTQQQLLDVESKSVHYECVYSRMHRNCQDRTSLL